jgi:hypothetical protein
MPSMTKREYRDRLTAILVKDLNTGRMTRTDYGVAIFRTETPRIIASHSLAPAIGQARAGYRRMDGKPNFGAGGIKCPCCRRGSLSDAKRVVHRHDRHAARAALRAVAL